VFRWLEYKATKQIQYQKGILAVNLTFKLSSFLVPSTWHVAQFVHSDGTIWIIFHWLWIWPLHDWQWQSMTTPLTGSCCILVDVIIVDHSSFFADVVVVNIICIPSIFLHIAVKMVFDMWVTDWQRKCHNICNINSVHTTFGVVWANTASPWVAPCHAAAAGGEPAYRRRLHAVSMLLWLRG